METRRSSLARGALYLLAAILGGVLATTTAAVAASSVAIPISGTVDGSPESVSVSGLARISSTLVKTDAKFHHPPRVILDFDLHHVSGTGISTGTHYVTRSRDELLRPLVASDVPPVAEIFQDDVGIAVPPGHADALVAAAAALLGDPARRAACAARARALAASVFSGDAMARSYACIYDRIGDR